MRLVRAALALAIAAVLGGVAFGQAKAPAPPATDSIEILRKPMALYVARGEPDACGPDCNEWIAAEGGFDIGSAARLRAFISKLPNAKLPIYFHSAGGLADRAFTIGRLLRERGITAGVSRTLPEACSKLDDKACDALKRSGQVLIAELAPLAACNSACVFALIGAKVRQVPPGARLGVHSGKLVRLYSDGRIVASEPGASKMPASALNASTRKYIAEMGIDVRLLEIASNIPHESAYYLSRDEIMNLGIDKREFQETRWLVNPTTYSVTKLFIEAKGPDRREFRTSSINLSCRSGKNVGLLYVRGLASGESGAKPYLRLEFANRKIVLEGPILPKRPDNFDLGHAVDYWVGLQPLDLLNQVAAQSDFEVVFADTAMSAGSAQRATRLSTVGLSQAISVMRQKCGGEAVPPLDQLKRGSDNGGWVIRPPLGARSTTQ